MDRTGLVTFVSPRWSEFTGEDPQASLGLRWQTYLHPDDLPAFMSAMRAAFNSRQAAALETRVRRRDGVYRWLHVTSVPRFDAEGRFVGLTGATTDVTELRSGGAEVSAAPQQQIVTDIAADIRAMETALRKSETQLRELSAHAERVREEERRNLARTLHDELGQLFTSLKLELASAISEYQRAPREKDLALVDRLQSAAGLLDIGIATVRQIASALRPAVLDHGGLVPAIQWEAAGFSHRTGIRCRVAARPRTIDVDQPTLTALYRILLEALANIARHAHAGAVSIFVHLTSSAVFLHVCDNGRGITVEEASNAHTMGISGMRERARALGGTLQIGPKRGGGTRLVASIPVNAR